MIIKRGDATPIMTVIPDSEHNIDDEGTHKAFADIKKKIVKDAESEEDEEKLSKQADTNGEAN